MLRLLRSDLSGPDIARELIVSLNTLRTHTKNIYTKLGVNNRREACAAPPSSACEPRRSRGQPPSHAITPCDVRSPGRSVRSDVTTTTAPGPSVAALRR